MSRRLRPVEPGDHAEVLALNQGSVELLAPMDGDRLGQLLGWADRFDVIDADGAVAGFVVTFAPGTAYDSPNYVEFTRRFGGDFYYLDRIVVSPDFRRQGLGYFVYDELERHAAASYSRFVLEVNSLPPNEPSLAFHRGRGYVDVAELAVDTGPQEKRVLLMVKALG